MNEILARIILLPLRLLIYTLRVAAIVSIAISPAWSQSPTTFVGVVPFTGEAGGVLSSRLTAAVTDFIAKRPGIQIVDRARMSEILSEIRLAESGIIDAQTSTKLGAFKGIQYLIVGNIDTFDFIDPVAEAIAKNGYQGIGISIDKMFNNGRNSKSRINFSITLRIVSLEKSTNIFLRQYKIEKRYGKTAEKSIDMAFSEFVEMVDRDSDFKSILGSVEANISLIKKDEKVILVKLPEVTGIGTGSLFTVNEVLTEKLNDGTEIKRKKAVCYARLIKRESGIAVLELGKLDKNKFRKDDRLLSIVRAEHIVVAE